MVALGVASVLVLIRVQKGELGYMVPVVVASVVRVITRLALAPTRHTDYELLECTTRSLLVTMHNNVCIR